MVKAANWYAVQEGDATMMTIEILPGQKNRTQTSPKPAPALKKIVNRTSKIVNITLPLPSR